MNVTKQQRSALVGMILGDGYLQKTGESNARLRLEHGLKQRDYLIWKTKLIPQLFQGKPTLLDRVHPQTKRTYRYIRHQSNSSSYLGKMRRVFYVNNIKVIPKNLSSLLISDIGLAIWYFDDGYYYPKDNSMYLYLGRVTRQDAEIARNALQEKFSLQSTILDKKHKGFVIYFSPKESRKISQLIRKYVIPSMAYKIPS
ncbi:hypothetical protein M1295_01740 [Patescibacteria group bacterium]|nr:hypothetical protein [Patescibacteria group bacterium]